MAYGVQVTKPPASLPPPDQAPTYRVHGRKGVKNGSVINLDNIGGQMPSPPPSVTSYCVDVAAHYLHALASQQDLQGTGWKGAQPQHSTVRADDDQACKALMQRDAG